MWSTSKIVLLNLSDVKEAAIPITGLEKLIVKCKGGRCEGDTHFHRVYAWIRVRREGNDIVFNLDGDRDVVIDFDVLNGLPTKRGVIDRYREHTEGDEYINVLDIAADPELLDSFLEDVAEGLKGREGRVLPGEFDGSADAVFVKRYMHTGRIRRPACELGVVRIGADSVEFELTVFYDEQIVLESILAGLPRILPRMRILNTPGARIAVSLLGRRLRRLDDAKACMDDIAAAFSLFNVLAAINE